MECKFGQLFAALTGQGVLIETLWNVNTEQCPSAEILTSFNRNIVECKSVKSSTRLPRTIVLIETLWNVNTVVVQFTLST